MKYAKHLVAATAALVVVSTGAFAFAAPAPSTLPTEQQALLANGFTETSKLAGTFQKQDGACDITVQVMSKTSYLVSTSGKLASLASSIRPGHVVDTAALMEANCQG